MLPRGRFELRGGVSLQVAVRLHDVMMSFASLVVSERIRFEDALPRAGRRDDRLLTRHRT